jgi:hypothetical protein
MFKILFNFLALFTNAVDFFYYIFQHRTLVPLFVIKSPFQCIIRTEVPLIYEKMAYSHDFLVNNGISVRKKTTLAKINTIV